MKKTLLSVCLLCFTPLMQAQKMSSKDSIKVFYDKVFYTLKNGYLLKDQVNWQEVETETNLKVNQYDSFENSLQEIQPLFEKIGATHCSIHFKDNVYSIPVKFPPENFSEQWKVNYSTKPVFEVRVIDGKYGYILMPAINFLDTNSKNIQKIAQPLYDQIAEMKAANKVKGWIIDLRFNTGGNSWPMLLSLYDFLGDNVVGGVLDINKKQVSAFTLRKGGIFYNSKKLSYIKPNGELLYKTKVAIITGLATASSGEIVALAFKGRANTIFIGEKTAGFTTGNSKVSLPFDVIMSLTGSYDSDRNNVYYEKIIPDIEISKQDNFEDLSQDKNIQEAIQFIGL